MNTTSTAQFNLRTGSGVIHIATAGRTYRLRGYMETNREGQVTAKADCGALTSTAASITKDPATCPKCITANA